MDHRISATELARRLGDVLGRVRYQGARFVVERNGDPVAHISPLPTAGPPLAAALAAWRAAAPPDPEFAEDLAGIGAADRAPDYPWDS